MEERKMNCYEKLKELDKEIKFRYPEKPVFDGIVDFYDDNFNKAKKKILWILKEANMRNWEGEYLDLSEHLRTMDSKHGSFKTTWRLVLEISYAIMENAQNWEDDVTVGEVLLKEGLMKQLAVIEVKKTFGGGDSDQGEIDTYYKKDKDIILAQIEVIEPDFIINGSGVIALFDDLKNGESKEITPFKVAKCKYKNGKEAIILNVYHPNLRGKIKPKQYFELVRDCIKAVS
jgi:hypothetical protein